MSQMRLFSITSVELALLKSNPPKMSVSVTGMATTSGWTNPKLVPLEEVLSADGILDLDFVAKAPTGIVLQVLTPIAASLIWDGDADRLVGVKVYSRTGEQVHLLGEAGDASGGRGWSGPGWPMGPGTPITTFAVGEESFPTTWRHGEEGMPTTMAIGEEGPKPFFGETDPRVDDPKPPFGEDGPVTMRSINPFGQR